MCCLSLSLMLLTNSIQCHLSNLIVTHQTWCPTFRQLPLSLTLLTNLIQRHLSNLIITHWTWCPTFHQPPLSLMLLINSIQHHSPDLMSNFLPTVLVINIAHQLNPMSHWT